MNDRLYRLIFNVARGSWMPVPETAHGHGAAASSHPARHEQGPACPLRGSVALLAAAGYLIWAAPAGAQAPLPGATLPVPASNFVASGSATTTTSGANLTVNQTTPKAILNWNSFNISSDAAVRFAQPNAAAAALNRIHDANPSLIQGRLTANGQIYLINQNGIIFANGAQVNVGGLVASTLQIDDQIFNDGLLSARTRPVFSGTRGLVEVQAGASLKTESGGRIMLLAADVKNSGVIETPDGQTILAAGKKVYLIDSLDPQLRGLLVEVDSGGTAANLNLGQIIARKGNITIAGLAVNQQGRVSATTAVATNGSVRLQARDTAVPVTLSGRQFVVGNRGGTAELGENSLTEVLPEVTDKTTSLDSQPFNPSTIQLAGKTVRLKAGARVVAPGGKVEIRAVVNPANTKLDNTQVAGDAPNSARVYFEPGSLIDVSGTQGTSIAMERNSVPAQLFGNELADSPLLRNSFLRGETVYVDARKGTALADVSKSIDQVGRSVGERAVAGGTVSVKSEGDVIFPAGAAVDVSGGYVNYAAGHVYTSKLISQGKVYDITEAGPDRVYEGFADAFTKEDLKWGVTRSWYAANRLGSYEPGYVEGGSAGRIEFVAPYLLLEGSLHAGTVAGRYQRQSATRPLGGQFVIGQGSSFTVPDYRVLSGVQLVSERAGSVTTPGPVDPLGNPFKQRLTLYTNELSRRGFTRLVVNSNGDITLAAGEPLKLAPGGSVEVQGRNIDLGRDIDVPSGTIAVTSTITLGTSQRQTPALTVDSGVGLYARGLWTNDLPEVAGGDPQTPIFMAGGTIALASPGDLTVSASAVLDTSGGGWLKRSGQMVAGDGGNISLLANEGGAVAASDPTIGRLTSNGSLRAFGLGNGGTLTMQAGSVRIGGPGSGDGSAMQFQPAFFSGGGFSRYDIIGLDGVTVAADTNVSPRTLTWVPDASFGLRPSGADLSTFAEPTLLPVVAPGLARPPASVRLAATRVAFGELLIEKGARIVVDPAGGVELVGARQLTVLGEVRAPGGTISVALTGESTVGFGFLADQSVWLGSESRLDVSGVAKVFRDSSGLRKGEVLAGGSISINARKGYVVAEPGALLDVSGASSKLDLLVDSGSRPVLAEQTVASQAGSISVASREGGFFDATLRAERGASNMAGGALSMRVDRSELLDIDVTGASPPYPTTDGKIRDRELVVAARGDTIPTNLQPGDVIDTLAYNGKLFVSAERLASAGLDRVTLKSRDRIVLQNQAVLSANRRIDLDAPALALAAGAKAEVRPTLFNGARSPLYVTLGNADPRYQPASFLKAATTGSGELRVSADLIDLVGNFSLQEVRSASLASTGDIRLRAVLPQDVTVVEARGTLSAAADLNFAADQVYPTTLTNYEIRVVDNSVATVSFSGADGAPIPLSAGGTLMVSAPQITQAGVIRAPLGRIELNGGEAVRLAPGSITSVTAAGNLIPLGTVENGRDLIYAFGDRNATLSAPPAKTVVLRAPSLAVAEGAVVDLSGGGDVYAYEFTVGPGGSRDVLADPNTYAILPWLGQQPGPYDYQYASFQSVEPFSGVHLSGVAGLADGTYALLPAHYALLPGAYTISRVANTRDLQPSQRYLTADGSQVVSGYRVDRTTGAREPRASGFLVAPARVARTKSEFADYSGTLFFAEEAQRRGELVPRLPIDAGRLALVGTRDLVLDGAVLFAPGMDGRGGNLDIAAPAIVVNDDASLVDGAIALSAKALSDSGAESILVGGLRNETAEGIDLDVQAQSVQLANSDSSELSAPEIIIAAREEIALLTGSVVKGAGKASPAQRPLLVGNQAQPGSGDGALVRVSSTGAVPLVRGNVRRSSGEVVVHTGATVSAGGAITLDATKNTRVDGDLVLGAKGSLQLGASRISAGEVVGSPDGLVLRGEALADLPGLASLLLKSYSSIDLYGDVILGGSALRELQIDAGGLVGHATATQAATLEAARIALSNSTASAAPAGPGHGSLTIKAEGVELGSGSISLSGFAKSAFDVARSVLATGTEGSLSSAGELTVTAAVVSAQGGSRYTLKSGGLLRTAQAAAADTALVRPGGQLILEAQSIEHGGHIRAPGGRVELRATGGASNHNVELTAGSLIDTSGLTLHLRDETVAVPGGQIVLTAASANVLVDDAAIIDVRAPAGVDAGLLSVGAPKGTANLRGTLLGASPGGAGGQFQLDVKSLADFSALNATLEPLQDASGTIVAGGFTGRRTVRLRGGDLTVGEEDLVTAQRVTLAADDGDLVVEGTIDARGPRGGRIELLANQAATAGKGNVRVAKTARLLASALATKAEPAGTLGDGGSVFVATGITSGAVPVSGSSISLADGALVDVGAKRDGNGEVVGHGRDGSVLLRAPRIDSDRDVAVAELGAQFVGAREISLEAYRVYTASSITASPGSTSNLDASTSGLAYGQASSFISLYGANTIKRLGQSGNAAFHLRPGVEVRSAGDLVVAVNETSFVADARGWDLNTWRFAGEPGYLTLRAAGDLSIKGSISDGFVKVSNSAMPDWTLDTAEASWSYRLVGGADFGGANPLAVSPSTAPGKGNVNVIFARLGSSFDPSIATVRTGTGSIDVAAARNFALASTGDALDGSLRSAVLYTAGRNDTTDYLALGAFTVPERAVYPVDGGRLRITAGEDIVGAASQQLFGPWLFRRGKLDPATGEFAAGFFGDYLNTSWWIRTDQFRQDVAALGGGDVEIVAGRNVIAFSASIPTTARSFGTRPAADQLVVRGGGSLLVEAGADIRSSVFYAGKGSVSIKAGASIDGGPVPVAPGRPHTIVAIGDAQASVRAGTDVRLETVLNPTVLSQSGENIGSFGDSSSFFFTFTPDSAALVSSLTGSVALSNDSGVIRDAMLIPSLALPLFQAGEEDMALVYPGSLRVEAAAGDIELTRQFALHPAPQGRLELLAGRGISIKATVGMSDIDPKDLMPVLSPREEILAGDGIRATLFASLVAGPRYHAIPPLHANDPRPVVLYAMQGDVVGVPNLPVILPKRVSVFAGRDVHNLTLVAQNVAPSDRTVITAGRDIEFDTQRSATSNELTGNDSRIEIGGPGGLELVAGRNIDLGNSAGVLTKGNLINPSLPDAGAGIAVLAGLTTMPTGGPRPENWQSFANRYVADPAVSDAQRSVLLRAEAEKAILESVFLEHPDYTDEQAQALVQSPAYQARLASAATALEGSYQQAVNAWTAWLNQEAGRAVAQDLKRANPGLGTEEALQLVASGAYQPEIQAAYQASLAAFYARPVSERARLVFFNELRSAGRAANQGLGYGRGYEAIASLFPATERGVTIPYEGDVNLFFSQVKTERGGDVNMFVPGGRVVAGVANVPRSLLRSKGDQFTAAESRLGVFTIKAGDIRSFSRADFFVNQSRVLTAGGGGILLWSTLGNIDAGKGAKTAVAAPPPLIRTDASGNIVTELQGVVTGSGIGVLLTSPDLVPGDIDLIAPSGEVNAGDAGIRAAGNLNIAAVRVVGADNIQVGGVSTGVPVAPTAPGVALGGLGNVAAEASKSAERVTQQLASNQAVGGGGFVPSFITVEVLGLGE